MRPIESDAFDWQSFLPSVQGSWVVFLLLAAAALGALGLGIAAHTYFLRSQRPQGSFRTAGTGMLAIVWILPALALLGFFTAMPVSAPTKLPDKLNRTGQGPFGRWRRLPGVTEINFAAKNAPAPGAPVAAPPSETQTPAPGAHPQLPDWIAAGDVQSGDKKLVVLSGEIAATPDEAEKSALAAAVRLVGDDFAAFVPDAGRWLPRPRVVRELAVRQVHVERIDRATVSSGTPFHVYRAHQQVELSAEVRKRLYRAWEEEVVDRRIWSLGGLVGLLTLTFGTTAAYFRLDQRTAGLYRGRLKLAAVSFIAAVGAVVAVLL